MHKSKRSQATEIYKKRKAAIKKGDLVKVTRYGKYTEVMFAKNTPPKGKVNIRRKHGSLINSKTREIINVDHATSRSDLLTSLKRSLKTLSHLIACNFKGGKDEKFITLTYSVPYQLDPHGAKKIGNDCIRIFVIIIRRRSMLQYLSLKAPFIQMRLKKWCQIGTFIF